jgi:hypothetical protein
MQLLVQLRLTRFNFPEPTLQFSRLIPIRWTTLFG